MNLEKLQKHLLNNPDDLDAWDELYSISKNQWSRKFIDSLPVEAFALEKSREFPHHDLDGKLDIPHLKNSIENLKKCDLSETDKEQVFNHLNEHLQELSNV